MIFSASTAAALKLPGFWSSEMELGAPTPARNCAFSIKEDYLPQTSGWKRRCLRAIFGELPARIDRAGIFLAGCGNAEIDIAFPALRRNLAKRQNRHCSDRESALRLLGHGDGIVVSAGVVLGDRTTGRQNRECRGGDTSSRHGGGYFLSIQALRLLLREYDLHRAARCIRCEVLHALSLNYLDEVVRWGPDGGQMEIAMLGAGCF